MLPPCLLDIVFDYHLQLKVHSVNCAIRRKMRAFKAMVLPHLVERWLEWVQMESARASYPHIYGPEGDYQIIVYMRRWWYGYE